MTKFLKLSEDYIINIKFIKSISIHEKYNAAHIIIANTNQTLNENTCEDEIVIFGEGSNEFNRIKEFIAKMDN